MGIPLTSIVISIDFISMATQHLVQICTVCYAEMILEVNLTSSIGCIVIRLTEIGDRIESVDSCPTRINIGNCSHFWHREKPMPWNFLRPFAGKRPAKDLRTHCTTQWSRKKQHRKYHSIFQLESSSPQWRFPSNAIY